MFERSWIKGHAARGKKGDVYAYQDNERKVPPIIIIGLEARRPLPCCRPRAGRRRHIFDLPACAGKKAAPVGWIHQPDDRLDVVAKRRLEIADDDFARDALSPVGWQGVVDTEARSQTVALFGMGLLVTKRGSGSV
jgi:hypothetical protein